MSTEASQEYQCAVEEAANAFMKVMSLRGFQVRDYPQNFVAQMAQTTRLAFEANRQGAHNRADALVSDMLNTPAALSSPTAKVSHKNSAFTSLRSRLA